MAQGTCLTTAILLMYFVWLWTSYFYVIDWIIIQIFAYRFDFRCWKIRRIYLYRRDLQRRWSVCANLVELRMMLILSANNSILKLIQLIILTLWTILYVNYITWDERLIIKKCYSVIFPRKNVECGHFGLKSTNCRIFSKAVLVKFVVNVLHISARIITINQCLPLIKAVVSIWYCHRKFNIVSAKIFHVKYGWSSTPVKSSQKCSRLCPFISIVWAIKSAAQ